MIKLLPLLALFSLNVNSSILDLIPTQKEGIMSERDAEKILNSINATCGVITGKSKPSGRSIAQGALLFNERSAALEVISDATKYTLEEDCKEKLPKMNEGVLKIKQAMLSRLSDESKFTVYGYKIGESNDALQAGVRYGVPISKFEILSSLSGVQWEKDAKGEMGVDNAGRVSSLVFNYLKPKVIEEDTESGRKLGNSNAVNRSIQSLMVSLINEYGFIVKQNVIGDYRNSISLTDGLVHVFIVKNGNTFRVGFGREEEDYIKNPRLVDRMVATYIDSEINKTFKTFKQTL